MRREEGHYTVKRVDELPKRGNFNFIYIKKDNPIEAFYLWTDKAKYDKISLSGSGGGTTDVTNKLDRGGYVGTAQDIVNLINALGSEDHLVSANFDSSTRTLSLTDASGVVSNLIIPDDMVTLVNDLTTGGTTSALTAQQGVELKALIDDIPINTVNNGITLDTNNIELGGPVVKNTDISLNDNTQLSFTSSVVDSQTATNPLTGVTTTFTTTNNNNINFQNKQTVIQSDVDVDGESTNYSLIVSGDNDEENEFASGIFGIVTSNTGESNFTSISGGGLGTFLTGYQTGRSTRFNVRPTGFNYAIVDSTNNGISEIDVDQNRVTLSHRDENVVAPPRTLISVGDDIFIKPFNSINDGSQLGYVLSKKDDNDAVEWIPASIVNENLGIVNALNSNLTGTLLTTGFGEGKILFTNGSNVIQAVEGLDFNSFINHGSSPFFYAEITIILPNGDYRYVALDGNTTATNGTLLSIGDTYDSNGMNNISSVWDQATGEYNWFPYPVGKLPNGSNDFGVVLNSYGGINDAPGSILMGDTNVIQSSANFSLTQGRANNITGRYSIGVGDGLIVNRRSSAEFGQFNVEDTDNLNQRLLGVGVGTSTTNRLQGFEVRTNGLSFSPIATNALISSASNKVLTTREYVDDQIAANSGGSGVQLITNDNGNIGFSSPFTDNSFILLNGPNSAQANIGFDNGIVPVGESRKVYFSSTTANGINFVGSGSNVTILPPQGKLSATTGVNKVVELFMFNNSGQITVFISGDLDNI